MHWISRAITLASSWRSRKVTGVGSTRGFFVLEPEVFDYLRGDEDVWEQEPLRSLASAGHPGCLST